MVYLRFLVSSQPFLIFSSCLMSIIKLEGSSESTFSMKRVRCCTSFTNLACCLLNRKNSCHETKYPWDSTLDEFLDLPWHILEVATTEEHNMREILVVGQSGCGLSINMKCVGGRNKCCQKLWIFSSMQCDGDVENRNKVSMQ